MDEEWDILKAWGKFRQEIRQILHENGIRSNPGWSDQNVIDGLREMVRNLKGERDGTDGSREA